jgi:hypothetical protein
MKSQTSINSAPASLASPDRQVLFPVGELRLSVWAFRTERLLSPLISTGRNGLGGHQAVGSPGALHLHRAFNEMNLVHWLIHSAG